MPATIVREMQIMNKRIAMLIAVLGAAAGMLPAAALANDACIAAWKKDVQPLANTRCVACHQDAAPAGKLSLQRTSAPASIIGVKSEEADMAYVTPGDPSQSYLFRKLEGTQIEAGGSGARMPLGGVLADTDLEIFRKWITECTDG